MKTIYRYAINDPSGVNDIQMPMGEVLSAGITINPDTGAEEISIWAKVFTATTKYTRRFLVFGTGADMEDTTNFNLRFIGTVQKANRYAFHVFEVLDL